HNMVRCAHGVPLTAPLTGGDEIAKLDRTFRQMSETLAEGVRKERALIDNVRDVICSLDAGGVLLSANAAAQSMFGCEADNLTGKLFFDFVAAEDRQRVIASMRSLPVAT